MYLFHFIYLTGILLKILLWFLVLLELRKLSTNMLWIIKKITSNNEFTQSTTSLNQQWRAFTYMGMSRALIFPPSEQGGMKGSHPYVIKFNIFAGTCSFRAHTFIRSFCLSIMSRCERFYFIEYTTASSCYHASCHLTVGKALKVASNLCSAELLCLCHQCCRKSCLLPEPIISYITEWTKRSIYSMQ